MHYLRVALGRCLGCLVWLLAKTWRYRLVDERVSLGAERPEQLCVYAFWHGAQLPLLGVERRRPASVLVSLSADGTLQSGALGLLGLDVVRGSSSRRGAAGFRALLERMACGQDAVFAVDGPRGPRGRSKLGALRAAERAGAALCPVGTAACPASVVSRSWDKLLVPWPFARVSVVIGAPLLPGAAAWDSESLDARLRGVSAAAEQLVHARSVR